MLLWLVASDHKPTDKATSKTVKDSHNSDAKRVAINILFFFVQNTNNINKQVYGLDQSKINWL